MLRHPSLLPVGIALVLGAAGCVQPPGTHPAPSRDAPAVAQRAIQQVSQVIGPGGITQTVGGVSQTVGSPFGPGFPFAGTGGANATSTSTSITGPGSVATVTTTTSGGSGQTAYSSTVTGNREEIRAAYAIAGPKALEVSNLNGNIVVTRSPDNTLSIEAIKESSAGPGELGKAVVAISNAGTFSIRTTASDPGAKVAVNYLIRVPAQMTLGTITTGSGTVTINR